MKNLDLSVLLGAAFLMATSSIGPGFLTQTTVFTQQLAASFGFVILITIILDIGAQLNVWRVIGISGKRGQDVANMVLPGLGYFVALLIVMGGLGFNIGNIAGAGMGFNVLFGIDTVTGAVISAIVAISIFIVKEAGRIMDKFTQAAGLVMIVLTLYVAVSSAPPVGEAVLKTFAPDTIDPMTIVTIVGGTVGGYITFSGGHRLIDAGITGKDALPQRRHRHLPHRRDARAPLPRHPRRHQRRNAAGQLQSSRFRIPARYGQCRLQGLRRRHVGRCHFLRCRRGIHLRFLHPYLQ